MCSSGAQAECCPFLPILQEESEKQLHLAEAQTKEVLLALLPDLSISAQVGRKMTPQVPIVVREQPGPTMPVSLQNYAEWLREVKEKGSELLKKPPASVEPSLVSDTAGWVLLWLLGIRSPVCSVSHQEEGLTRLLIVLLPSGHSLQVEGGRRDPELLAG